MSKALEFAAPLVKAFEGCAKRVGTMIHAYLCAAGHPTQGWGIVVKDLNVPPITQDEADRRFAAALPAYLIEAAKLSPTLVAYTNRWAAVGSFVFNLGGPRYRASTLRRKINAGEWDDAADEFDKWVFGGGRRLPGLVRRRAAERQLFEAA